MGAAAAALLAAAMVAAACTGGNGEPSPSAGPSGQPSPTESPAGATSPTHGVLGAPDLVDEPDPAAAPSGVDTSSLEDPPHPSPLPDADRPIDPDAGIFNLDHLIFIVMENRSFDHYFGTMRGVRGFGDPHPVLLPSGKPVWFQPDGSGILLPFRPAVDNLGLRFLEGTPHGWTDTQAAWNAGKYDQWVANKGIHHDRHSGVRLRWSGTHPLRLQ